MASLNQQPGSSTGKQRCALHRLKRRKGWTDEQLHATIGADSTTKLSAQQASDAITRLGGGDLPNPPGQAPPAYTSRATPGATRIITVDHVSQIKRMLTEQFPDPNQAAAWLLKNFQSQTVWDLQTAQRAGQVIRVLNLMAARPNQEKLTADS